MAYDALRESAGSHAVKEYLRILEMAAKEGEALVDDALGQLQDVMLMVSRELIEQVLAGPRKIEPPVTAVKVEPVQLSCFDALLEMGSVQ